MYGTFKVVRRDKERVTVCGGGGGGVCQQICLKRKKKKKKRSRGGGGGGGSVVTDITFNTRKQTLIAVIVSKQCPLLKSRLQVR